MIKHKKEIIASKHLPFFIIFKNYFKSNLPTCSYIINLYFEFRSCKFALNANSDQRYMATLIYGSHSTAGVSFKPRYWVFTLFLFFFSQKPIKSAPLSSNNNNSFVNTTGTKCFEVIMNPKNFMFSFASRYEIYSERSEPKLLLYPDTLLQLVLFLEITKLLFYF